MAHNVQDIYNELKSFFNTNYPSYNFADYIGQFENNGEWNPSFPAVLIKMTELNPDIRSSDGASIKPYSTWNLYIGVKNTLGLDIAQSIFDSLNNANINVSGNNYTISVQPLREYNQRTSVISYLLQLKIQ